MPLCGKGLPSSVTSTAFLTSHFIIALKGPGPGGICMVFGEISNRAILGGNTGPGGGTGSAAETDTVKDWLAEDSELDALRV